MFTAALAITVGAREIRLPVINVPGHCVSAQVRPERGPGGVARHTPTPSSIPIVEGRHQLDRDGLPEVGYVATTITDPRSARAIRHPPVTVIALTLAGVGLLSQIAAWTVDLPDSYHR